MPRSTLLALLDSDDLACIEALCPDALTGHVLAFDADIHLELTERGLPHLTPWDIIAPDERPRMQAYEAAVWQHWARHGRINFEGINLLGMAAFRHVGALARLTWIAYALRRAIEHLGPETIVAFDEGPCHGLDQPADYAKMPLLFGVLRGLAEQAGLPVRLVSRQDAGADAGFEDQIAKRSEITHPPVDVEAELGDRPVAIFHANGDDLLRQLHLIRKVRSELGCQAVQLYKDAAEPTLARIRDEGHPVWHESQVTRWRAVEEIGSIARESFEAFQAASRSADDDLRVIFDNPHVRCHFEFLFGEYAAKMAQHVRAWRSFFARCKPAGFVANYHAPILDVAVAEDIPALCLPHGLMMYGHVTWFAGLPERATIGAFSERHRATLIGHDLDPQRIIVTGDPYGDQLLADARRRETDDDPARDLRERYDIAPNRRIVLVCTTKGGMPSKLTHLPYVDWADGVRCTRELADLARRRGEWQFVIKPHPRWDLYDLYARLNRDLPADRQLIVLDKQPLAPAVQASDAVCCWCVITSALIEASLHDRPVMMLSRNLIWYDRELWATEAWPHVSSLDEFEAALDRLFSDTAHYAQRVEQTTRAAREFLGGAQTSAADSCLDWFRNHSNG